MSVSDPDMKQRKPPIELPSLGHAGASRKSPSDAPWGTSSLRLGRPVFAPLLTMAQSWRYEEELMSLELNPEMLSTTTLLLRRRVPRLELEATLVHWLLSHLSDWD